VIDISTSDIAASATGSRQIQPNEEHIMQSWNAAFRKLGMTLGLFGLGVLTGCQGLQNSPNGGGTGGGGTPPPPNTLKTSVNHIVVMLQENRSLDHYFGAMRQYWADNGYPDQAFEGLPQFPTKSPSGPPPSNLGCDPTLPFPGNDCQLNANSQPIQSFHLLTQCLENPSPSWNEGHVDFNFSNPTSGTAMMDGFVFSAAHDSRTIQPPFTDVSGQRVMGYYDGSDLNYYYFMASNFATSDAFFAPVMTRSPANHMYLIGGTSQGHVYPLGDNQTIPATTIFEKLQNAGITWKIYVHPDASGCATATCLYQFTYVRLFSYGQTILSQFPQNIVPQTQFISDAKAGTLPQVAFLETPSNIGLDEHPADFDATPACCSIQAGADYVSTLISAVMTGPSWKDSIFLLTYDEAGGFYDHVSPVKTVSPDGIKPVDLQPGDICTQGTGPTCDFTYTGYRLPLLVISPFAKKNYVSHTNADYTAILKLIETRFGLGALTARDAAQMDMTEFFDFSNPPSASPPSPPAQNVGGACYLDHLP
jgi:phospholipase C